MENTNDMALNSIHVIPSTNKETSLTADEIETILCAHSAVQEASVKIRGEQQEQKFIAYIVPNINDQSIQKSQGSNEWHEEKVSRWQVIFDQAYKHPSETADPTFDPTSWESSYTKELLPEHEVRQMIDSTVSSILTLKPKQVMEIGCGTGMLLFQIAPHCEAYYGTDISAVVLETLQERLDKLDPPLPNVKLLERGADNFDGITANSLDTIVLNSVVQYFPSIDYLAQMIESAVERVTPGGAIFIGDVRSLPLLETYHTSIQLYQAADSLEIDELRKRIQLQLERENELVVDPRFFIALKERIPKISQVDICPKQGRYHNELTKFRYQVVIHIGKTDAPSTDAANQWDWAQEAQTLPSLRHYLSEVGPEQLRLTNIPNARLSKETEALKILYSGDLQQSVSTLKEGLAKQELIGIDPYDLWSLADEFPYEVQISWEYHDQSGRYDALLIRQGDNGTADIETTAKQPTAIHAQAEEMPSAWQNYATNPLRDRLKRQLVQQLRQFAKENLPASYMPSAFVVVDELPQDLL